MNNIENLITTSLSDFLELSCVTEMKTEMKSRLVFPIKRDGKRRVSEQEIRFLFIQEIENNSTFHYSVEVPTKERYKFLGINDRSASFDVCLYENGKRKHLIEFKALNPQQSSYSKDFEKLIIDETDLMNYFIQVIQNTDNGTIPNIEQKYKTALEHVKNKYNIIRPCLKIFLCDMGKKNIVKYEVDKNGNLVKS
jgi:hypothetical protein